ncbi:putative spore germination protein GerPC [Paenibacillus konkukensis]|uniref:Spore germination protein GerPC n=2 Tax=Paenibacillus konkukensis TaxID=2020716 RepID=A0ABY4RKL4_9BACL|nr:spore germination protein GerPC [Paenibacillus doosanensis]UQZ82159.1 putative spore germination protein GerPC [Paenibacillus konkukensis]
MYYLNPDLMRYMQQIQECLNVQSQQIEQMNAKIQEMDKEIKELKSKPAQPPVIRNEYRFDLFKVEKLEGTLNIGLNPNPGKDDSSIDEFTVGQTLQTPDQAEPQNEQMFQDIQEQVGDYLNSDAYRVLQSIERQYRYPLDEPYRKFIVEDVRKQIDKRIRYYLSKYPDSSENVQEAIIEEVKRDIEKTFEAFIQNLPKKGDWN